MIVCCREWLRVSAIFVNNDRDTGKDPAVQIQQASEAFAVKTVLRERDTRVVLIFRGFIIKT